MEAIMQPAGRTSSSDRHRCLLVTGDHEASPRSPVSLRYDLKRFTPTDCFTGTTSTTAFWAASMTLALVNGNHYPAARQIVFVDRSQGGDAGAQNRSQISRSQPRIVLRR